MHQDDPIPIKSDKSLSPDNLQPVEHEKFEQTLGGDEHISTTFPIVHFESHPDNVTDEYLEVKIIREIKKVDEKSESEDANINLHQNQTVLENDEPEKLDMTVESMYQQKNGQLIDDEGQECSFESSNETLQSFYLLFMP